MTAEVKAGASVGDQLRSAWFSSVAEISSIGPQRRTWLDRANRNPHWSYIEFMSSYPDRDQLGRGRTDGWLSAGEFEALEDLRAAIADYAAPKGDAYDNGAILDDPAWHELAAAAERARRRLLAARIDARERGLLLSSDAP
jgi:hypothetical protein